MSSNKRKNPEWARIEKECAKKRVEGKAQVRPKSGNSNKINYILSCQELTVQRLSAELSPGKVPKYGAMGARVFVPYTEEDVTIDGIKRSCIKHFSSIDPAIKNSECDVLASERGPSCTNLSQIPNISLINVRFIASIRTSFLYRSPFFSRDSTSENLQTHTRTQAHSVSHSIVAPSKSLFKSIPVPRSLSISTMLKLGQTIQESKNTLKISISDFQMTPEMTFEELGEFDFTVETKVLGRGAFRNVFRVTCPNPPFNKGEWVLKRYNAKAKEDIENSLKQSLKQHTRKVVQMTSLSEYFASKLRNLSSKTPQFKYVKAFYGEIKYSNEFVTIEQFIPGGFDKYLNNDGKCIDDILSEHPEINLQAEALAHFSFCESQEKLLLTDIQGSGNLLTDPEVASAELIKNNEYLFCCGNYCRKAIRMFCLTHHCNRFCREANLNELDKTLFENYDDKIILANGEVID